MIPRPPRSHWYRLLVLGRRGCGAADGPSEVALVQRCVDPQFETVGALDFGRFGAAVSELIMLASCRWLLFEEDEGPGGSPPPPPLLAATHAHRHCRGKVLVGNQRWSVSKLSSCYSKEFAAAFGLCWARALRERRASLGAARAEAGLTPLDAKPQEELSPALPPAPRRRAWPKAPDRPAACALAGPQRARRSTHSG